MSHRRPSRTADRAPLGERPMTVAAASDAGWTRAAQRHAAATGRLDRLRHGVVAASVGSAAERPDRLMREAEVLRAARAALLTCPRAAISHAAAAIAHGMPVVGPLDRPCLTVAAGTALRTIARVHLHRATLPPDDVLVQDGERITSIGRTIMDVAREHGVAAGVAAADHALRSGLCQRAELTTSYEVCAGWPGRKAARLTLLLADARAESALESLSRLRMLAHGLPRPELQVEICDEHGRFLGRTDFYWDDFGVVGEADGALKYADGVPAILSERARQAELESTGLLVVRWGWADVFSFDPVAQRLRTAFARGARARSQERRWGVLLPSR